MHNPECDMPGRKSPSLGRVRIFTFCILHFALLISATGCASKAKAATAGPDGPPLAMPFPPPRVIAPVEEQIVEAAPPVTVPEPSPAAPNPTTKKPPAPRTDPPAVVAPPASPPPPPVGPPPEVRAGPSLSPAEEKKVLDVMARATRDLNRVDYQKLSVEGKAQYNQSKRFSTEAEQAIKERNYVFAMVAAEKAATLAGELAGR
jgi:hypothetical protein